MTVQNMQSPNGNPVANQFIITTDEGTFFQSYKTTIAFMDRSGNITLDANKWDCSTTTSKYRNIFTGLTTAETKKAIKNGTIALKNLN